MRKLVITFLLGGLVNVWALDVVLPNFTTNDGGTVVTTGDPQSPEEWK